MSRDGVSDFDDGLELLRTSELFSQLVPGDGNTARLFRPYRWSSGQVFSQDWCRDQIHLIVDGHLELTRFNARSGRAFTMNLLAPGDVFDAVRLAGDREHAVTPTAVGPLTVLSAPYESVRRWSQSQPTFEKKLMRYLVRQLVELEDTATDLAIHDTPTRLARRIARFIDEARGARKEDTVLELSNEVLARMIGSVRVVVNRHIQDLKRAGVVQTSRGRLAVSDPERLFDVCE